MGGKDVVSGCCSPGQGLKAGLYFERRMEYWRDSHYYFCYNKLSELIQMAVNFTVVCSWNGSLTRYYMSMYDIYRSDKVAVVS